jgi:hypothetical protein
LAPDAAQSYADDLCAIGSVDDVERVVDRLVTDAAASNPTVIGRDVTGVTLLPFQVPAVRIVYLHRSDEPTFEGFMPWIIGPEVVLSPVAVSSPMCLNLDGVNVTWQPHGLTDAPTGSESPITDGLVFSFRAHPDREHL